MGFFSGTKSRDLDVQPWTVRTAHVRCSKKIDQTSAKTSTPLPEPQITSKVGAETPPGPFPSRVGGRGGALFRRALQKAPSKGRIYHGYGRKSSVFGSMCPPKRTKHPTNLLQQEPLIEPGSYLAASPPTSPGIPGPRVHQSPGHGLLHRSERFGG